MLPLALLPIALQLVPDLLRVFAGDKTGKLAEQAADMVRTATGTTDPSAAQSAIAADPVKLTELRIQLAGIIAQQEAVKEAARLETYKASLADRANARDQTKALAAAGSILAWGAPVVSFIVMVAFGVMCWYVMTRSVPEGSQAIVLSMLEALKTLATAVVFYWVGSSRGSAAKDERQAGQGSGQQPTAVATTGDVTVTPQGIASPTPDDTPPDVLMDRWNPRGRKTP